MAMTTIQVSKRIRDRIAALGAKGDTYNDILDSVLGQAATYRQFMEQQYEILDNETEWTPLSEVN